MSEYSTAHKRDGDSTPGGSENGRLQQRIKEVRAMKDVSAEDIMAFPNMPESRHATSEKWPRQRFWMFRLGLIIFDISAVYGAFLLLHLADYLPFSSDVSFAKWFLPVLFVFCILPFFQSGDLYSYHLIFSKKRHFTALYTALTWGTLAAAMVMAQYIIPLSWETDPIGISLIVSAFIAGLFWFLRSHKDSVHNLFNAAGISLVGVGFFHLLFQDKLQLLPQKSGYIMIGIFIAALILTMGRYVIIEKVYHGWLMRHFRRQVGIVGTNEAAEEITSHIIDSNAPFWVSGTIGRHCCLNAQVPKHSLGDIIDIPSIAKENRLSDIIITDEDLDRRTLISLLDFSISKGITVWFPPSVLPIIDEKIYIDHFCGMPMIRMCQQKRVVFYNRFKTALDAIVALPLMVLLLPLFIIIAAAIKMNSKGPIFYMADAIGRNGRPFKMFKFRSMRVNNDNDIHKEFVTKLIKGEMEKDSEKSGPLKITDDPRVTAIGNLLRKSSLDELPQLINVIMGQMSLIGPRPCLPYEYDVYEDWYKKRASIRPGITGLWQVAGRSEVEFEEMILLDLYYVYNRNIWMDINILYETIFVVLKKKGAY